jgi:uncharacterized membrane protein
VSTHPETNAGGSDKRDPESDGKLAEGLVAPIKSIIEQELPGVPPNERERASEKITEQVLSVAYNFSGPVPPPAMAASYEQLCPGFVDRTLTLVENEQRAAVEAAADERQKNDRYRREGLWIAAGITLSLIVSGVLITFLLPESPGWGIATIFGGPLVGLLTVFVRGRPLMDRLSSATSADETGTH